MIWWMDIVQLTEDLSKLAMKLYVVGLEIQIKPALSNITKLKHSVYK